MNILAIETATRICGVAFVRDGKVVASDEVDQANVHAERLLDLIVGVLRDHGGIQSVEGVAVSIGPGSFTGLRIGVSAAKGLVYGTGRILVGVPTLTALIARARSESRALTPEDRIVALLPARRGEYFFAREGNNEIEIRRAAQIAEDLAVDHVVLTGQFDQLPLSPGQRVIEPPLRRCSAAMVGIIGDRLIREGKRDDVAKLEPQYSLEFFLNADMTERT
ncbi:MAG TPA: tRNA (adenosine(37)-N6)-threonylcarbamoyltransferase complex dimerization subunit type 1 TsaB [Bacteroidota bacterium]|nr:tRNA (adenosine(37)-N6)-threonylcarbamoyltransferase complex dimerization subunit type 1 TsaB [Bacteroidota bacterium]